MKHLSLAVLMALHTVVFGPGLTAVAAQDLSAIDFYVRGEAGFAAIAQNRGYWCGPGCAVPPPGADPRILYDLDTDPGGVLGVAAGASILHGLRGDVSLSYFASRGVDGTWIATDPAGVPGPHADQSTDVSALAVMANLFVEPLALAGYNAPIQPFITGGVGLSFNTMDDWTRTNTAVVPVTRTFEGATNTEFAWSIGGGISASIGQLFGTRMPVMADLTYRYIDLGNVRGGMTPLPGNGASTPDEPFNFDLTNHVVSVGLRIPFSTGG